MKTKTVYVCQHCGSESPRWSGQCLSCNEWNSLVEEVRGKQSPASSRAVVGGSGQKTIALRDVEVAHEERFKTGIGELDRVLGGGITPGSLILVGGDPGIGKSTLMLQMCVGLERLQPLYVTGEESLRQIKLRSGRLHIAPDHLQLLSETNVENIIRTIENGNSGVVIIDSIQTMFRPDIESAPGSVAQVRECTAMLMQTAKSLNKSVFLVGHVTKEGAIAGPKVLEHIVDTVLQFEGERVYSYRILRAAKNRYGSTNEIGVFEMAEEGLREVKNPSELFLSQRNYGESGTAVVATMEGTRAILIEVQALVTPTSYGVPQRSATGFEIRRLQMILAVLEKRLGMRLGQFDVFINIAGGVRLDDPAVDLGIAAAIVSSARDIPLPSETVLMGEIGLTGEVRTISSAEIRLNEAHKLGFAGAMVPESNARRLPKSVKIKVEPVEKIASALASLLS